MSELALRDVVAGAVGRTEVLAAIERLYEAVQGEIDRRRPVCQISGRCCRFEEFGHRLFVTTLELAYFKSHLDSGRLVQGWDGTGCPFQQNKLCGVHAIRPFGCRMFFCDATSTEWQNQMYEQFHRDLRRLHDELDVAYFYVEWRLGLRTLGLDC